MAANSKEKLRIDSLRLLHFDSRDDQIIRESLQQVLTFTEGLQLSYGLTNNDILSAYTAADEYYIVLHALARNTDFAIPVEAIAANSILYQ